MGENMATRKKTTAKGKATSKGRRKSEKKDDRTKPSRGFRTSLTDELTDKIARTLRGVGFLRTATEYHGVPYKRAAGWFDKGKDEYDRMEMADEECKPHLEPYVYFYLEICRSRALLEAELAAQYQKSTRPHHDATDSKGVVYKHQGDPGNALTMLKILRPDTWGGRRLPGSMGNVTVSTTVSTGPTTPEPEEVKELDRDELARRLAEREEQHLTTST